VQSCVTPIRRSVDPDGLAALRLAVAVARDPRAGIVLERAAFRSLPQPRGGSVMESAPAIEAVSGTAIDALRRAPVSTPAAAPASAPVIPTQPTPIDPAGEQLGLMALVEAAQNGDGEAFGQLYDRYVDVVHRYISYRVGNHALAEDLTSETFLRALRRISSFTWQGRDFGAWLVTIARNLIADHFKSSRYKMEHPTSDLVEAGADRREDGPEDEVLSGITNAALLDAVKKLGPEQQECIVLRFLQGMSVAETAAVLGKNEGAVKALQYRAVKALGRLLPEDLVA
jgi:RNA polymerase sigma-70 factor (ECF subfamily)